MTDYRRFISYIYAYDRGIKSKNVGFAKMEVRDGDCRITINIKGAFAASGKELEVYLFRRDQEQLLGSGLGAFSVKNGTGEFRATTLSSNIGGSGIPLEEMSGIILRHRDEDGRMYASGWDDQPIAPERLLVLQKEGARRDEEEAYTMEKEELSAAELPPIMQAVEEELARLRASMQSQPAPSPMEPKPSKAEPLVTERELLRSESPVKEPQREMPQPEQPIAEPRREMPQPKPPVTEPQREIPQPELPITEPQREIPQPDIPITEPQREIPKPELPITEPQREIPQPGIPITEPQREIPQPEMPITEPQREMPQPKPPVTEPQREIPQPGVLPIVSEEKRPEIFGRMEDRDITAEERDMGRWYRGEKKEIHNGLWNKLESIFPKVVAFEDEPEISCLKIDLKDLEYLPRENWGLASNSFLLHGYYNFRYLILAKMEDRYMLGIPGMFHNNERFMAAMFGFDHFKPVKDYKPLTGHFGYWYQWVSI